MQNLIKKYIVKALRRIADKIDSDNCELSSEQAMHIMSVISHEIMSKDEACNYLNLSRSRFDDLVRSGKLPKNMMMKGLKEDMAIEEE